MRVIYTDTPFNSLADFFGELERAPFIAVDTETVSVKNLKMLVIGIAWHPTRSAFFSCDDDFLPELIETIRNKDIVFHNTLFDEKVFKENFGYYPNAIGDTMLLAQSLGYPPALQDLSWGFNFPYTQVVTLIEKHGRKVAKKTMLDANQAKLGEYCAEHAAGTYLVWNKLKGCAPPSYYLDVLLLPRLREMTKRGIRVDRKEAQTLYDKYNSIVEERYKVCNMLGFNPESGKQIGEQLQATGFYTGRTKKGKMRTDAVVLGSIANESIVASTVLSYREYSNMVSTFLKPRIGKERIYPEYHIVRTGRFAGKSPNPQNIPKFLRSLYIPEKGHMWFDADAHQIEPTLQAYMSKDPVMIEVVKTGDIYNPIAKEFHISRPVSKTVMLALSYGASVETLAEKSGLSIEDADRLVHAVLKKFNVFANWRIEQQRFAEEHGYVETLLGKRRMDMPQKDAVNSVIQGAGAIVLKLAMLRLSDFIISTTVHDEILISADKHPPKDIFNNLIEIPISWEWKVGKNWRDVV